MATSVGEHNVKEIQNRLWRCFKGSWPCGQHSWAQLTQPDSWGWVPTSETSKGGREGGAGFGDSSLLQST